MEESDAFYVVRKGDVIGVYKSFSDCQQQLGSSVSDPSVSIYKGYSLRKETEEYLGCHGLKNAAYTISAVDHNENLFDNLIPCPVMIASGYPRLPVKVETRGRKLPDEKGSSAIKRPLDEGNSGQQVAGTSEKRVKLMEPLKEKSQCTNIFCFIEFDGASKGNPGHGGAGAIIRLKDGTVVARLREGLGSVTNNVAEYRAAILGMKCALQKGFKQVHLIGDSQLVCNQIEGKWQTKHPNLMSLCKEAKELKKKFDSFVICHVERARNSDADKEANLAVHLANGEVYDSGAAN